MKKVGLFIDSTAGGGAFQYCQTMLYASASLCQHGIKPIVYYTDPSWKKYLKECGLRNERINPGGFLGSKILFILIKRLPIGLRRFVLAKIDPGVRKMIAEKCNLWIFTSRNDWMFLIQVRLLAVVHDLMHRYEKRFPECSAHGEYERRERISKNVCYYSVGIIVDSELGRKQFCESYNYPLEKTYPLPFIAPPYVYKACQMKNLLEKYHLPKEYVFYPAQFWQHKNHTNLVKAVASLKRKIPNINLVLSGFKSKNFPQIEKLVEALNIKKQVFFLDYVDDEAIVELYKKAKMLVMPTYCGPTNIPPLEAFVLGCPVAASNVYAVPEQLGNAALLFNPDLVDEIASAIEKIWTDEKLRRRLITRGKMWTKNWGQKQFDQGFWEIIKVNL